MMYRVVRSVLEGEYTGWLARVVKGPLYGSQSQRSKRGYWVTVLEKALFASRTAVTSKGFSLGIFRRASA